MIMKETFGKKFFNVSFPVIRNKYVLTLLVFGIWIFLFDQNNLLDRFRDVKKLNELEQEKEYYKVKIEQDKRRMKELITDKANLEKFAREEYLMKRENEDVFVVIKDE